MKTKFTSLISALLLMHFFSMAQFVREYNPGPTSNLVFTCIAKAHDGNYFISGLQDTSIYVSEVLANGNLVREKLIGVGTDYYRIGAMIVDADGNIVMAGVTRAAAGGLLHGFLIKVSPALSVMLFVKYDNASANDGIAFSDIKDYRTTGVNNAYYVTAYTFGAAGWNPMLAKLDRNNGNVIAYYYGRPSGTTANNAQGNYASLLLDTVNSPVSAPAIYVSAPLNSGSGASNRPWLVKHDITTLNFTKGERYLRDITAAQTASLYNIGIAKDANTILYCWYGSPNVVSNSTHTAMGLTKADAASLTPAWQKRYTLAPASATAFKYNTLNKVESDPVGYITRGGWFDGVHEGGGDIFFIRTDKNGLPLWSKQYKNVSNLQSFNSSFIVDGGNIYAVGYRTNTSNNKGILIVTPLATGSMDTTCALPLTVATVDSTYAKLDNLTAQQVGAKLQNIYDPINCVTTTSLKPCDGCINHAPVLDANFTLTGQLVGNLTQFTLTASAFSTANNSQFIVSQVSTTFPFPDIAGTVLTQPVWGGPAITTGFQFYQGTSVPGTNNPGKFIAGNIYRIRHILSAFSNCGILTADTVSKLVFLAPGLRASGNGNFIITTEGKGDNNGGGIIPGAGNAEAAVIEKGVNSTIFPNPANSFVTFNTAMVQQGSLALKVVNGSGAVVANANITGRKQSSIDTHLWASGLYLYSITSNGKVVAQGKFIIQH